VTDQDSSSPKPRSSLAKSFISKVKNAEHFQQIMDNSNDRLLVVEFYADWCPPCKELTPILEEIAKENKDKVDVYEINTDENSNLAYAYRVTGIPHVVFIKNKENLMSLNGLYPKEMYLKVISRFSQVLTDKKPSTGDGAT
jgi:thioredoxin